MSFVKIVVRFLTIIIVVTAVSCTKETPIEPQTDSIPIEPQTDSIPDVDPTVSLVGKTLYSDKFYYVTAGEFGCIQSKFKFLEDSVLEITNGYKSESTGVFEWNSEPAIFSYSINGQEVTIEGDLYELHISNTGTIIDNEKIKWNKQEDYLYGENFFDGADAYGVIVYGLTISTNPQIQSGPYMGWRYEGSTSVWLIDQSQMALDCYTSFSFGTKTVDVTISGVTGGFYRFDVNYPQITLYDIDGNVFASGSFADGGTKLNIKYHGNLNSNTTFVYSRTMNHFE